MGPARAVQGLWGDFMVVPNTVGGHFSHPVWQAAVHEAQGSEAQKKQNHRIVCAMAKK